jgi:hypothetical protein
MNTKWKDMTAMQKAGFVILCIGAAMMLVAFLKPGFFPVQIDTTLALVVMSVGEAMDHWEKSRKWAWLFIAAGVICLVCWGLELFLL